DGTPGLLLQCFGSWATRASAGDSMKRNTPEREPVLPIRYHQVPRSDVVSGPTTSTRGDLMEREDPFGFIGLTYDDVMLLPGHTDVIPSEADTSSRLTRRVRVATPLISAAMD